MVLSWVHHRLGGSPCTEHPRQWPSQTHTHWLLVQPGSRTQAEGARVGAFSAHEVTCGAHGHTWRIWTVLCWNAGHCWVLATQGANNLEGFVQLLGVYRYEHNFCNPLTGGLPPQDFPCWWHSQPHRTSHWPGDIAINVRRLETTPLKRVNSMIIQLYSKQ